MPKEEKPCPTCFEAPNSEIERHKAKDLKEAITWWASTGFKHVPAKVLDMMDTEDVLSTIEIAADILRERGYVPMMNQRIGAIIKELADQIIERRG